jgi:hypothetical protein
MDSNHAAAGVSLRPLIFFCQPIDRKKIDLAQRTHPNQ